MNRVRRDTVHVWADRDKNRRGQSHGKFPVLSIYHILLSVVSVGVNPLYWKLTCILDMIALRKTAAQPEQNIEIKQIWNVVANTHSTVYCLRWKKNANSPVVRFLFELYSMAVLFKQCFRSYYSNMSQWYTCKFKSTWSKQWNFPRIESILFRIDSKRCTISSYWQKNIKSPVVVYCLK